MIYRIKAAWQAFLEPRLIGEALGMRHTLHELHPGSNEFALLYAEIHHGYVIPMVKMLPYETRESIRRGVHL